MNWPPKYDRSYVPQADSEYWDRQAETMSPQERETVILDKLSHQVRYAYEHSAFYREFWRDAGAATANIRSFDDFRQLPILTKDDLRREQEAHPPFGRYLCIPRERVVRIHGTSGTTGNPTVFGIGGEDWERIAEAHARILWAVGLRPDDWVIVTSVFSAYIGSWGALLGAERLGAKCFPFGAGAPQQTERAVDWIELVKPTALYGTPSYAIYLAATARRMGVIMSQFAVLTTFVGGYYHGTRPGRSTLVFCRVEPQAHLRRDIEYGWKCKRGHILRPTHSGASLIHPSTSGFRRRRARTSSGPATGGLRECPSERAGCRTIRSSIRRADRSTWCRTTAFT